MEFAFLFLLIFGVAGALSFLFSGMEAGFLALNNLRIRQQMRAGHRGARVLFQYLQDPEDFLWTILIGNNLANFVVIGLLVSGLYLLLGGLDVLFWMTFVLLVFAFYALCDLLPKMLFRLFPNRLCMGLAVPFRFIHIVLSPLVGLMTWFSDLLLEVTGGRSFTGHLFRNRGELRLVMQESAQSFTTEERIMINRVMDLQNVTVRSVTVPMSRVVTLDAEALVRDILDLFRREGHSRMVVLDRSKPSRQVIGIVHVDKLIFAEDLPSEKKARKVMEPALYLDEDVVLEEALSRMRRQGRSLAVVVGRDNRELGLVSLVDILKFIFGEVTL